MGISLDGCVGRNRHRARIAFIAVRGKSNVREGRTADYVIRDAHGRTGIQAGSEIGMKRDAGADEVDDRVRVWVDGQRRDVLVPEIVRGKWNEAIQIGSDAQTHLATGLSG